MRWRLMGLSLLVAVTFWAWLNMPPGIILVGNLSTANAHSLTPTVAPTSTVTVLATPTPMPSSHAFSIPLPDSLIQLIGGIIVALIGGAFILYQLRRNARLEREKMAAQTALERERNRADIEKIHLQDRLAAARSAEERERQYFKEKDTRVSVAAMRDAQTPAERARAYREVLHADPRIARLHILDMSRPLEVTNVYVQVRLHQEARPGYELDPKILSAETRRDPNALLQASRMRLESRASTALAPEEAIRTYKNCVIVGDPGAGKSTLLKYLTLKAIDKQLAHLPELPIHIELNAFASSGHYDLLDFISTRWNDRYGFPKDEARTYMEENLAAGSALLLLDALDETVIGETVDMAEASYRRVVTAISELATLYHKSPIVVTARKAGYQQRVQLDGFTALEVLDFRPEDIQRFVTNWFSCYPGVHSQANARDLNARLERNPRIHTLAANPLLLSLIVIAYEAQLDLPDRRAELYKQCVDTLLTKWDASRGIRRRREFKPEHKHQLLGELAWHFHAQGQRYFPESELLAVIADFLPAVGLHAEQNGQVLEEIAAENGLLKEQAQGWYGFLHLTLQEYFVAQYVVDHNELDTLLSHQGDPWWEEVLLLYAGSIPDASPLLQKLIGQGGGRRSREDIFYTNLLLAGHCLASRPTIRQVSLRKEIVSRLFDTLKETPYSLTRQHVAEVLSEIGGNEVNTELLRLLADAQVDLSVRRNIATALGQLGERSVVPDLLRLLADAQVDSYLRMNIATALGQLGEDESTARTLAALLLKSDIADSIHSALWTVSRRAGVRVFIKDWKVMKRIKVIRW